MLRAARDGKEVRPFAKYSLVKFSPDSRRFIVPHHRTHVRLYETSTSHVLATLSPPNPTPIVGSQAMTFNPDDQWLLAAENDGETVAWNLQVIRIELGKLGLNWQAHEK